MGQAWPTYAPSQEEDTNKGLHGTLYQPQQVYQQKRDESVKEFQFQKFHVPIRSDE